MRILFILEYYYPHLGGVETLFKNLCEGLVKDGHDVIVVTSLLPGMSNTSQYDIVDGVEVRRIKTPNRYWFSFLSIPLAIYLAEDADIIHTTTYNGALPARIASKVRRKPCLITVHEILGKRWAKFQGMSRISALLHRFLERAIIKLGFDCYVGVSKFTANAISAYGKDADTVYNGIDYNVFNRDSGNRAIVRSRLGLEDSFVYMSYGRPGLTKGIEYLVMAVPIIRDSIEGSKLLLLLGREPVSRYNMIMVLIESLGIQNDVICLDTVPYSELPDYIAASDCVVIPSLSEGFGFSATEACAMGKPIVASNVASLPEVVSGDYVLVEAMNPAAIAKGVRRVHDGNVTASVKKLFAWDACIAAYSKIYERLSK